MQRESRSRDLLFLSQESSGITLQRIDKDKFMVLCTGLRVTPIPCEEQKKHEEKGHSTSLFNGKSKRPKHAPAHTVVYACICMHTTSGHINLKERKW